MTSYRISPRIASTRPVTPQAGGRTGPRWRPNIATVLATTAAIVAGTVATFRIDFGDPRREWHLTEDDVDVVLAIRTAAQPVYTPGR